MSERLEELLKGVEKAKEFWCVDQEEWYKDWKPIDDLVDYIKEKVQPITPNSNVESALEDLYKYAIDKREVQNKFYDCSIEKMGLKYTTIKAELSKMPALEKELEDLRKFKDNEQPLRDAYSELESKLNAIEKENKYVNPKTMDLHQVHIDRQNAINDIINRSDKNE